ncbi:hypothetical protein VTK56DRAFT_3121 [Thermocarpiscus australiensis]
MHEATYERCRCCVPAQLSSNVSIRRVVNTQDAALGGGREEKQIGEQRARKRYIVMSKRPEQEAGFFSCCGRDDFPGLKAEEPLLCPTVALSLKNFQPDKAQRPASISAQPDARHGTFSTQLLAYLLPRCCFHPHLASRPSYTPARAPSHPDVVPCRSLLQAGNLDPIVRWSSCCYAAAA